MWTHDFRDAEAELRKDSTQFPFPNMSYDITKRVIFRLGSSKVKLAGWLFLVLYMSAFV